jgi:hypothetical protein
MLTVLQVLRRHRATAPSRSRCGPCSPPTRKPLCRKRFCLIAGARRTSGVAGGRRACQHQDSDDPGVRGASGTRWSTVTERRWHPVTGRRDSDGNTAVARPPLTRTTPRMPVPQQIPTLRTTPRASTHTAPGHQAGALLWAVSADVAGVPVDGFCRRILWVDSVDGVCGRVLWAGSVGGFCGRVLWAARWRDTRTRAGHRRRNLGSPATDNAVGVSFDDAVAGTRTTLPLYGRCGSRPYGRCESPPLRTLQIAAYPTQSPPTHALVHQRSRGGRPRRRGIGRVTPAGDATAAREGFPRMRGATTQPDECSPATARTGCYAFTNPVDGP